MRRIGVLLRATADDAEFQARVGAFLQALALLSWTIGRNVRIDMRPQPMPPKFGGTRRNWPRSRPTSCWLHFRTIRKDATIQPA
jgi:hypothetical protein